MPLKASQVLRPVRITQKAIEGLFHMIAIEENKIRVDPLARVSDLLAKVFGSLK